MKSIHYYYNSARTALQILQDFQAILQDFEEILQDFQAILQEFQEILQDFQPILQDFQAILQDFVYFIQFCCVRATFSFKVQNHELISRKCSSFFWNSKIMIYDSVALLVAETQTNARTKTFITERDAHSVFCRSTN